MTAQEKIELVFQIDEKQVAMEELERKLKHRVKEAVDSLAAKKVSYLKCAVNFANICRIIFGILAIIAGIYVYLNPSIKSNFDKIALLGILCVVVYCFFSLFMDIDDKYRGIKRFKMLIKKAKYEEEFEKKYKYLLEADESVEDFWMECFFELITFDFDVIDDFLAVKILSEATILENTYDEKKEQLVVKYANMDGNVETLELIMDEVYENTKITNNTLICTDKSLIFQKAYRKN